MLQYQAKRKLAHAITKLFAPAYMHGDLAQQATQTLFPLCVFTLGDEADPEGRGEVIAWDSPPAALSINEAQAAGGARIAGFQPSVGVSHGAADFFVVCSDAYDSVGLAGPLRRTHARFQKEHGRKPTFCVRQPALPPSHLPRRVAQPRGWWVARTSRGPAPGSATTTVLARERERESPPRLRPRC